MKYEYAVPYKSVNFYWVMSHYDIHLEGLCYDDNGEVSYFITMQMEDGVDEYPIVEIFRLSFFEKVYWRFQKFMFELFVNNNWSYDKKEFKKGFLSQFMRFYFKHLNRHHP